MKKSFSRIVVIAAAAFGGLAAQSGFAYAQGPAVVFQRAYPVVRGAVEGYQRSHGRGVVGTYYDAGRGMYQSGRNQINQRSFNRPSYNTPAPYYMKTTTPYMTQGGGRYYRQQYGIRR